MARLKPGKRARLPDRAFAYIDSAGRRRLPIHDRVHVRNALARFNQVSFEDHAARDRGDLDARRRAMRGEARREVAADGTGAEDDDAQSYFAAAGNAGSLPMSRESCWMMTVPFTFPTICFMRSIDASVAARS